MKAKRGKYRLSPNEEAQLVKDETERRRKQRILQVREQSKQSAIKIRQAVKEEKDRQIQKLAVELQNQLEKEKEEKVRKLEAQYENSLKSIGQGHKEAGEQYDRTEERDLLQKEDNRRAEARGSSAMEKLRREKIFREFEENKIVNARKAALEEERKRSASIAALPPPEPDPLLNLNVTSKKPVRMTDVDNFTTTHYHIMEQYSIDKADPNKQEDARSAAEEEERRIREKSQELVRLSNDRMARARVRHNNALEKEILSHDYDKMLMDLSDLQRADRERRLHVVADIPKQVFEPPHRRIEDREEHQRNLESAFEDMYMAQTNYIGDLSLALDPHPPPETPSATESLEVSMATDGTPVQEPNLPRVPPVLKDMTNIQRAPGEKSPVKKPEKVLKKLMDKIKSQRDDWISKSNGDLPENTTIKENCGTEETDEIPTRLSAPESTGDKSIDSVLEQQKEIENQKRVLEEKLMALEAEHAASKKFADFQTVQSPQQNSSIQKHHSVPPSIVNGHAPSMEQLSKGYSWSIPPNFHQPPVSSIAMTAHPYLNAECISHSPVTQQQPYIQTQLPDRIDMRIPDQPYPLPVTLLPREPVVSSLPKQYVPLSHRLAQPTEEYSQPPVHATSQIRPPNYTAAMSQIGTQREAGTNHFTQPSVTHQQQYIPPTIPLVQSFSKQTAQHPSLSMSSLSGSSREYYPQTFPTPSLPIPSTVGLIPVSGYTAQQDQSKKIKEYQQYLLQRHEQSKKVLADTRAEIERRRQELLNRFPQLAGKSPEESDKSFKEELGTLLPETAATVIQDIQEQPSSAQVSPSKAAISSLVSKLASDPYYASTLGIEESKINQSKDGKKFKDVRKSLPFDETLQDSPFPQIHDSGGQARDFDSTIDSGDGRHDLDNTVMSSSTDRGSPKLPGRRSGQSTESEMDTSSQSTGRDQMDTTDRRQQELKTQLEEIQRQKEAILQRHDMAHLRLHAEQERLKYQREEEDKMKILTPEVTSEDSTTEVETDDDRQEVLTTKQLRGPPQKQRMNLLSEHRPHELSTIQEVDTPRSAPRSLESGRPSLSSSGSSISRRSLDPYQLSTGTIPEEREPTPTNRRTVGDTGCQTQQIEEIMQKAREFDPSMMDKFKQQTNDIFASIATPPQKGGTPGSNKSLSVGSLTPDSLSTGPISDSNVSTQFNSPSDAPAFRFVSEKGKDNSRSDSSYPSGMSWADELSSYSGQQTFGKFDESSKASLDTREDQGAKSVDSSQGKSEEVPLPSKSPVDRKYDVFHLRTEQPTIDKQIEMKMSKYVVESASSDSSAGKLNLQELSNVSLPDRQCVSELSQYPLMEKLADQSSSGDQSKGYSSSSVINDSSTRESPVGGAENNDDSKLLKTGESLGSTGTSASSYMDLDSMNGLSRPFDFIGQFKFTRKDQSVPNSTGDLLELDSSKYSQKGGFTSTPYTTQDKVPELSHYQLTPTENQGDSLPQQTIDSSSTPAFIIKSREFDSDNSEPGSGEKKIGATLSQYSLKSDTQGLTVIGKELSQYSLGSDKMSPLSQYSLETTENISPEKTPTVGPSDIHETKGSVSQYSLNPSKATSGHSLPKGDKSLSQYSYGSELSEETIESFSVEKDEIDNQLMLHSLGEKSLTQGNLNESDLSHLSKMSEAPVQSTSLSQHTLESTHDDNDSMVDKKFANLDNLIKESRDLIAKHKQLITKNKEWEEQSQVSTPGRASSSNNANFSNIPVPIKTTFMTDKPLIDTSESSFNVTDDVSPMMITGSSIDMTQEPLKTTADSMSIDNSLGQRMADSALSRFTQLDSTAGISDEPDLTLVTGSDVSMTNRSDGSNNNDSVWSFEQHEQSAMSSPDITENDFPDLPDDKGQEAHPSLAGQTLQESVERRQQSMPSVKRDAGEDVVFRAVPVVVSPTLALSMKMNAAEIKPKAPVSWASELAAKKVQKTSSNETNIGFKSSAPKQEPKKEVLSQKLEKQASSVQKPKQSGNLNPALQPRSAGSVPSPSGNSQGTSSVGLSKSGGIISLGEFLKRQVSNEDNTTDKTIASVPQKNSAVVTTKNKPGLSINAKLASPSKTSFYDRAKESGKTPSFSIGKKTGTTVNNKPGIYSSGKSQVSKPASNTHMTKTLSSWKKSRAVKSAPPPPKQSSDFPAGAKDLPNSTRSEEDKAYERHMRLQNRLGIEEPEENQFTEEKKKSPKTRESLEEKQKRAAANRDKVKEFQKKLQENMKKKQMQKKQES